MADTQSHRAVECPALPALRNVRVILLEPRHPGNIGSSARAMKTAGLRDLVLVRPVPYEQSDEARSLASGAQDVLEAARSVPDLDAAARDLHVLVGTTNRRRDGVVEQPIPARQAAARIAALAQSHRVGLLFGREDFGLSSDDLARCTFSAAIPVVEGMPPLNLSHAVQVMAYEVLLAIAGEPAPAPTPLARVSEVEALLKRFEELLAILGPADLSRPPGQVLHSLRRIFARVGLTPRDVRTLHMVVRAAVRGLRR